MHQPSASSASTVLQSADTRYSVQKTKPLALVLLDSFKYLPLLVGGRLRDMNLVNACAINKLKKKIFKLKPIGGPKLLKE